MYEVQVKRQHALWPQAILLVFALLMGGIALAWHYGPAMISQMRGNPSANLREVKYRAGVYENEKSLNDLYKRVKPSVVNVTSMTVQRDSFTRNIERIPKGMGTGFVWDKEGRIVTNYHVIEGASAAVVTLDDGSKYQAQLVGVSRQWDLAVLRINAPADKLYAIDIGESKDLVVGQSAYAIGNPFGLDQSLASGIISALDREIESRAGVSIPGVIQTTAPINPGNSGGPLLDSDGRLIGVNTAILSPSGAWAGIGFALPVDRVNEVVTQIINSR
ncbi:MAG TPA: trypsin-like peptidase domain-containing protein [Gemmataceae bacterium]|nr:trypsin-like peptidase domain-containing protein [Gemmataceae bacterium]